MATSWRASTGDLKSKTVPNRISMIDAPTRVTHRRMFPTHIHSNKPPWVTFSSESPNKSNLTPTASTTHRVCLKNDTLVQNTRVNAHCQTSSVRSPDFLNKSEVDNITTKPMESTPTETASSKCGKISTGTQTISDCTRSDMEKCGEKASIIMKDNAPTVYRTQYDVGSPEMNRTKRRIIRTEPRVLISTLRPRVRSLKDRPPFYPPGPQPWQEINSYLSPNRLERIQQARNLYSHLSVKTKVAQNQRKSASTTNLRQLDTQDHAGGQLVVSEPLRTRIMSSVNLSGIEKTNAHTAVTSILPRTPTFQRFPSTNVSTKHKSVSLKNLSDFSSFVTPAGSTSKPFWSTLNVNEPIRSAQMYSGVCTPVLTLRRTPSQPQFGSNQPLKRTSSSDVSLPRPGHNNQVTRGLLKKSDSWNSAYRLNEIRLRKLQEDLLALNARANRINALDSVDSVRRSEDTKYLPRDRSWGKCSTVLSNPHVADPARKFVVIKSVGLINPRSARRRFISVFGFNRPLCLRLSITQAGSTAYVETTGDDQPLNLIHARIIYDLTYRSAYSLPWWWQWKYTNGDTTKLIGAQVITPRKARNKSKKNKPSASVSDMQALVGGEDKAELRRSRSQSRRRRLFEAVAARVDLRRSRSRSKGRSKTSTLEISGPIVQPRVVSEVFGQSPILYPQGAANLDSMAPEISRQSQIPTGDNLRSSVLRNSPDDRGQKAQSWDSSWDSTEDFPANGAQDPVHHPVPPEVPVTRQFKAPEHRNDTTVLQLLQSANKSTEQFCDVCYKTVNTEDRYHLIGRVLHRRCFTCSRCTAPLANRSAVCQNGIWSCAHHVQYHLNSIDLPFPEQ